MSAPPTRVLLIAGPSVEQRLATSVARDKRPPWQRSVPGIDEAVEALAEGGYDGALLVAAAAGDLRVSTLERLQEASPRPLAVVLLAQPGEEGLAEGLVEDGAQGWLPLAEASAGRLQAAIRTAVRRRRRQGVGDAASEAIFTHLPDAALLVDGKGRVTDANPAAGELTGVPSGELLGAALVELVTPETREELAQRWGELLAVGQLASDATVRRRDGSRREVELRAVAGCATDRHLVTLRDITEQRQVERALREEAARFRGVVEGLAEGLLIGDLQGVITYANPRMGELLGYAREELLGRPAAELADSADAVQEIVGRLERRRRNVSERYEMRCRRRDGSVVWLEIHASPLVDSAGRVIGSVGAHIDVTERKQTEEALRESERRYRLLFEEHPQPAWVYDCETLRFLAVNRAAVERYGYSREEFLAMSLRDIRPAEDVSALEQTLRGLAPALTSDGVWRHRTKNGEGREVEVHSQPLRFAGREARLVLALDVTERRRLEDQLRQAQKMEAVGRLAGGIAHDFNNLVTAILGYSELLREQLGPADVRIHAVNQVEKAAEQAATLTRQLLAFSRRQVLQPELLDLNAVVAEMKRMLERILGEDVELVTRLDAAIGEIRADPGQLQQVIVNLALNARDAMPEGGRLALETYEMVVEESYTRRLARVEEGRYVVLAVSDTGCGIPRHDQDRIFEPFFTTKEPGKGTGLGLSTVYGIVKQSGGYVWVYSEPGEGTTFRVYLPHHTPSAADKTTEVPARTVRRGGSETVLLAEDDDALRELIGEVLEMQGYAVLTARDGRETLDIAGRHAGPIDLLLTDVVMPDTRGPDLHARLSAERPGVRALFISGYPGESVFHGGLLEQGAAFLQKPFTPQALGDKIREVLDADEG